MAKGGIEIEIMQILTEYTAEIGKKINEAGEKLSKAALKDIGEASPKRKKYYKGRKPVYSKGWRIKKFGEYGKFRVVIYNQPRYMLTSILENGVHKHYPNGKPTEGKEHIKPIQDKLNRDFEKAVEKIINDT